MLLEHVKAQQQKTEAMLKEFELLKVSVEKVVEIREYRQIHAYAVHDQVVAYLIIPDDNIKLCVRDGQYKFLHGFCLKTLFITAELLNLIGSIRICVSPLKNSLAASVSSGSLTCSVVSS